MIEALVSVEAIEARFQTYFVLWRTVQNLFYSRFMSKIIKPCIMRRCETFKFATCFSWTKFEFLACALRDIYRKYSSYLISEFGIQANIISRIKRRID